MSTIYNILVTFSNLETFKERSGFGPIDMATAFGHKLQCFADEINCTVDFAEQHYGLILVLLSRNGFPSQIEAFKMILKQQPWQAPEAIQVHYQCGESDFDAWKPIISSFSELENYKPPACNRCNQVESVALVDYDLLCGPCSILEKV